MAENTCRVSPDALKESLDRGEKLLILDVRQPGDYDASSLTIPGAMRIDPTDLTTATEPLPRGSRIVTFCT